MSLNMMLVTAFNLECLCNDPEKRRHCNSTYIIYL